jgi:hypothetical protein
MHTLAKKLYLFALRPVCPGMGLARFIAQATVLAALLVWGVPALHRATNVLQLSAVHFVIASHLQAAQREARRLHVQLRFCRSDDALTCAPAGGWEQGWLAFEDRNGNGLRDRGERLVHAGSALPPAFLLQGDLNAGRISVCLRDSQRAGCRADQAILALLSAGSRPRLS